MMIARLACKLVILRQKVSWSLLYAAAVCSTEHLARLLRCLLRLILSKGSRHLEFFGGCPTGELLLISCQSRNLVSLFHFWVFFFFQIQISGWQRNPENYGQLHWLISQWNYNSMFRPLKIHIVYYTLSSARFQSRLHIIKYLSKEWLFFSFWTVMMTEPWASPEYQKFATFMNCMDFFLLKQFGWKPATGVPY